MSPASASSHRTRLAAIARRVMIERGLEPDFPSSAVVQARELPDRTPTDPDLVDLRALLWCSIDNDDSRDLDQLTVAESGPDDSILVRLAIADVDALVPQGSPIDDHARTNTTSVYTPGRVFPMLPERLSTSLTSLVEGEPRAAVVVTLRVNADGTVGEADIDRALVFNHAKLAYDDVAAWLDGERPPPSALAKVPGLEACLTLQDRAAQALRRERSARGALSLASSESRVVFDGESLTDLRPEEKNRAKALIEDFMIAANSATARFLETRGYASIRRMLRAPRRWDRIVTLASELGTALPAVPNATALDVFLRDRRAADPDRFPDLSLSVVKLLGAGEYAVSIPGEMSDGHFGLAARDYTHSTAPNRRFPDLVTQRLVKAAIKSAPAPYTQDALHSLARHCTVQEDAAEKVERHVRKSAAALLLSERIGHVFDGIVTGASEKGTWVRVLKPPVEGRVMQGHGGLDVGERTRVRLVEVDVDRGFIDFARVQ